MILGQVIVPAGVLLGSITIVTDPRSIVCASVPLDVAGMRAKIERGYYGRVGGRRWRKAVRRLRRADQRPYGWANATFTFGSLNAVADRELSVFDPRLEGL